MLFDKQTYLLLHRPRDNVYVWPIRNRCAFDCRKTKIKLQLNNERSRQNRKRNERCVECLDLSSLVFCSVMLLYLMVKCQAMVRVEWNAIYRSQQSSRESVVRPANTQMQLSIERVLNQLIGKVKFCQLVRSINFCNYNIHCISVQSISPTLFHNQWQTIIFTVKSTQHLCNCKALPKNEWKQNEYLVINQRENLRPNK